jgi:hypothetical protein
MTIQQLAEHVVEYNKLTPEQMGMLIDELIKLRYKAL